MANTLLKDDESARDNHVLAMGAPRKGQGGHLTPPGFRHKFSHIITVAPRVEIRMHFWKGAKFAGSVGHPVTKMLSALGGFAPLTRGSASGPRWGLRLQTPVIGSRYRARHARGLSPPPKHDTLASPLADSHSG